MRIGQCFRSLFTQPFIALKELREERPEDLEERAANLKAQLILHAKFSLEFLFQEGTSGNWCRIISYYFVRQLLKL